MTRDQSKLLITCAVISYVVTLLLAFASGCNLGRKRAPAASTMAKAQRDTLIIRDTLTIHEPEWHILRIVDTIMVAVHDTVVRSDTTFIVIDREQRHYKGDGYEAWVSGYRPELDSLRIFIENRYVTNNIIQTPLQKRWGIGIQAGYGVSAGANNTLHLSPYIGIGISYNICHF